MKKYSIGAVIVVFLAAIIIAIRTGHNNVPSALSVAPAKTIGSYIALGDSVAAGVGLKTDSDVSACDRTNESYPHQAAAALNYNLVNLACTGATLPAGIIGQQEVNQLMTKPQLDQLFARPKPTLISLTIGANDADWTTFFAKCYTGVCGSAADTAAVKQRLTVMGSNLQKVLIQIQEHYNLVASPTSVSSNDTQTPHVIVTGYHQVFPATPTTGCSDLTGVDANEVVWGRQQQAAINTTIQSIVKSYPFATYAAIDFSGHELCTTDPWVQGLADKEPYHPTEAGQTAFAKQIEVTARTFK